MDDATAWEIEDLTEVQDALGTGRTNTWVGVAIAVIVAVVGFGFIGRATSGRPEPGSTAGLFLQSPVPGATAEGGLVEVRGNARWPLGTVHLAVRLGDAVLGWTNIDVPTAGPVQAVVRVFAPPFDAPVRLTVESGSSGGRPGVGIGVDLRLRSVPGAALWIARRAVRGDDQVIDLEGFGRLGDDIDIEVLTADGRTLARTARTISVEDGRPGSAGASMIGLGSFGARLHLDDVGVAGGLVVRIGDSMTVIREESKPRQLDERRRE